MSMKSTEDVLSMRNLTGVLDYLQRRAEWMRGRQQGWRYSSMEEYVIENGQPFIFQPLPAIYVSHKGRWKECFANAFRLAMARDELRYAEGYAMRDGSFGMHHAWCVDAQGRVVDPTWDFPADYYGVIYDLAYVGKVVSKKGVFGVIDNWTEDYPLLRCDNL